MAWGSIFLSVSLKRSNHLEHNLLLEPRRVLNKKNGTLRFAGFKSVQEGLVFSMLQYKQIPSAGNNIQSHQGRAPSSNNSTSVSSVPPSYQRECALSNAQPHLYSQACRTTLTKSTPPPHPVPSTQASKGQVFTKGAIPSSNRHQQPTPPSRASQSSNIPRDASSNRFMQAFQSPRPNIQQGSAPSSARPFVQNPRQISAPRGLDQSIESKISTPRAVEADNCMEMWLIRHGETPENKSRVIAGHCTSGLTETG